MGLEYAGDADQAREDFLVETKINLTELGGKHDCIIVFREDQNFGGALQAELDVSAAEAFDLRKLRWEFVSHDYGGIPNQYIYGRQGWRVKASLVTSRMVNTVREMESSERI